MRSVRYEHRLDKIAIALLSGVNAKEGCVQEFGIGEDLPISIFCWKEDRLELVLSLMPTPDVKDHVKRFKKIGDALCIVRKGWGIDALTMLAEGWVSTNPQATEGRELREVYIEKGSPVSECLSITHVENDEVTFLAKPYMQTVGRKVVWEEELYFPGNTRVRGQNAMYPNLFARILKEVTYEEPPEDAVTYYELLCEGLSKSGFSWM